VEADTIDIGWWGPRGHSNFHMQDRPEDLIGLCTGGWIPLQGWVGAWASMIRVGMIILKAGFGAYCALQVV
jgi:hypothetical protein